MRRQCRSQSIIANFAFQTLLLPIFSLPHFPAPPIHRFRRHSNAAVRKKATKFSSGKHRAVQCGAACRASNTSKHYRLPGHTCDAKTDVSAWDCQSLPTITINTSSILWCAFSGFIALVSFAFVSPVSLSVTLVYCGQTVEWIKMKLGTQVDLGPSDIVMDGDPAPPPKKKGGRAAQFSAHVYCGQTAG